MPFTRPTLPNLVSRVVADFKSELGLVAVLRRSFLMALSKAIAGMSHTLHGHLVWISKQIFPDQAEAEYLDRWGAIYGIARTPATFAQLEIDVTFTGAATLSAGTVLARTDGQLYEVDADIVAVGAGTETGSATAQDAGATANVDTGNQLALQSPLANIESGIDVTATLSEGENQELDEDYRIRVVRRIQNPPDGGSANQYIDWALAVAGVTRAWVLPSWLGEGTVGITFVQDNDVDIIPGTSEVEAVQEYIDDRKPVVAEAVVFAPVTIDIDFDISISPDTPSVRAAIELELADLFIREAQVKGSYKTSSTVNDGRIPLSRISEAISLSTGEDEHIVNSPVASPVPDNDGELLVLGTITFSGIS